METGHVANLDAEVREARFNAKASLVAWPIGLGLLWVAWALGHGAAQVFVGMFGGFALVGAIGTTAKFIYHGSTVWVCRLSREYRGPAQVIVALSAALVPVWFWGARTTHGTRELMAWSLSSIPMIATTLVYGGGVPVLVENLRRAFRLWKIRHRSS